MSFRQKQIERQIAFGALHAWGFGSGGLDGADAAGQFGGSSDVGTNGGGGGYDGNTASNAWGGSQNTLGVGYEGFGAQVSAEADPDGDGVAGNHGDTRGLDPDAMNAATFAERKADDYEASSAADRRGMTDRENRGAGRSFGAREAGREAYGARASNGVVGLTTLANPVVGLLANAAYDAKQASDYSETAFGQESTTSENAADFGRSLARNTFTGLLSSTFGPVGAKAGYGMGGRVGAVVGNVAGKVGANAIADAAFDPANSVGAVDAGLADGSQPGDTGDGTATGTAVASAEPASDPTGSVTGYDSSFGDYDSHFSGFNSYSASSALNAFS